jgi:hypothetical protein
MWLILLVVTALDRTGANPLQCIIHRVEVYPRSDRKREPVLCDLHATTHRHWHLYDRLNFGGQVGGQNHIGDTNGGWEVRHGGRWARRARFHRTGTFSSASDNPALR